MAGEVVELRLPGAERGQRSRHRLQRGAAAANPAPVRQRGEVRPLGRDRRPVGSRRDDAALPNGKRWARLRPRSSGPVRSSRRAAGRRTELCPPSCSTGRTISQGIQGSLAVMSRLPPRCCSRSAGYCRLNSGGKSSSYRFWPIRPLRGSPARSARAALLGPQPGPRAQAVEGALEQLAWGRGQDHLAGRQEVVVAVGAVQHVAQRPAVRRQGDGQLHVGRRRCDLRRDWGGRRRRGRGGPLLGSAWRRLGLRGRSFPRVPAGKARIAAVPG